MLSWGEYAHFRKGVVMATQKVQGVSIDQKSWAAVKADLDHLIGNWLQRGVFQSKDRDLLLALRQRLVALDYEGHAEQVIDPMIALFERWQAGDIQWVDVAVEARRLLDQGDKLIIPVSSEVEGVDTSTPLNKAQLAVRSYLNTAAGLLNLLPHHEALAIDVPILLRTRIKAARDEYAKVVGESVELEQLDLHITTVSVIDFSTPEGRDEYRQAFEAWLSK